MKKRLLSGLLCLCLLLTLIPTSAYAYLGALTEQSPDEVTAGTETVDGMEMFYLENEYLHFSIDKATGLISYTLPTRLKDEAYSKQGKQVIDFSVEYPYQKEKKMTVENCTATQNADKTITFSYTFTGDHYETVGDANLTYHITYRLVRLDRGGKDYTSINIDYDASDDGKTWGVFGDGYFTYEGPGIDIINKGQLVLDSYRGVIGRCNTNYYGFPAMGHPTLSDKSPEAGIFISKYSGYYQSKTNISAGMGRTNTNLGGTYITEVYTDSYSWANPFVATSKFYSYHTNQFSGYSDNWGVKGFPEYSNITSRVGYTPKSTSSASMVREISEAFGLEFVDGNTENASRLWGYRDLRTKDDVIDPTKADEVTISVAADRLAIFAKSGGGYVVEPADSEEKLAELETTYGKPVAVFRGEVTSGNDTNYTFSSGAVALSPTVIATWGPAGKFVVSKDGIISHSGVNLNAPTFKFYQPANGASDEDLTFEFTSDGIKIGMVPAKNSATVYIDIPHATVRLESAMVKTNGDLVFDGSIRIDTVFDGAEFEMEKLGYGLSGTEFKVNGVKARGSFSTADLFNMDLAEVEGEINTFKSEEKYGFKLNLNAFDMFKTNAELELKRCESTGVLMPNNLYFYLKAGAGIPLVPPAVIGQLNGGGLGFYGLADTVNGDFFAIPPIALRGTVTGTYLHLVEGTGDVVIGPSRVELAGKNVKIVGTPDSANILDEFGYKLYLSGEKHSYKGTDYTGIAFGGSKYYKIVLPSKEVDIFEINGSIGASAFGGVDSIEKPQNLYLKVNANGKIEGIIKIPSSVPVLGDTKIAGTQLDAILGGQTAFQIKDVKAEEAAKQAFKNMDVYLGIATTINVLKCDFRAWVILPDVAKPKKDVNWGYDYKIWGKLDEWDWGSVGIASQSVQNSLQALGENETNTIVKQQLMPLGNSPTSITLGKIGQDEQAYLVLAFDESVTEEKLKDSLSIKNTTTSGSAISLTWLEKDADGNIINRDKANISSGIVQNEDKSKEQRLVLIHLGSQEVSENTFEVDAGTLSFECKSTSIKPLEKLDVSFDGANTVSGSVKYHVKDNEYVLRTYLGSEKGGADYLVDEREYTDTYNISVNIPNNGTLAPTGEYYVSTYLSLEKLGDWDNDPSTAETVALIQIDSKEFDSKISYKNNNQPEAPKSVEIKAIGNEVMQAKWSKVEGADGYKIIVYKKDDTGNWVDSGYGYELNTSDPNKLPAGLSYDNTNVEYSFNMALTVGGTDENGKGMLLQPGKDYKISVQARKTTDNVSYYSTEKLSNDANLPEYTPLKMDIAINNETLTADSDTKIYTGYVNRDGAMLEVSSNGSSASFVVETMDGNELTYNTGSGFQLPDFEGTLMLKVTGTVTNGSLVDTTTCFVLIYKDNVAPVISLDSSVFYADAKTGKYTVTGITEPGAIVDYGDIDEEFNPVYIKADSDGKFTIQGSLEQDGVDSFINKTIFLSASDDLENKSTEVTAIILQGQNYAPDVVPNTTIDKTEPNANGATVFVLEEPFKELTAADQKAILAENAKNDVVLSTSEFKILLPKGSLVEGFNINDLIVNTEGMTSDSIVAYTDLSGNEKVNMWSVVDNGAVLYIVRELGKYELTTNSKEFGDIEGLWGEEFIKFVTERGIFEGTGNGVFSPEGTMTRAMFVTVLWRMAGEAKAEGNTNFEDLNADWYKEAVRWAVENNITNGFSSTEFGPDKPVNREQMCVFLVRFMKYLGMELPEVNNGKDFADKDGISSWANEFVDICAKTGLVEGVDEDNFAPQNSSSRMQVSTLLTRFIKKILQNYCK